MKTFATAIFEAEKHTTQEPKRQALSGLEGEQLELVAQALNPYRVFGIKKFDMPEKFAEVDPLLTIFFTLLDELHDRTLTGNAAKAQVTSILGMYTADTARALARVIDKDLKCGATLSTFKKIYPGLDVPEFDLMGAEKMTEKYVWQFPCIGESKYDGQRAIAIIEGATVTYFSRSGRVLDHLAGLFDAELVKAREVYGSDLIIDGEVLAGSFQESMQAKGSDNLAAKAALKFYAFDIMSLADWRAQSCSALQIERSNLLEELLDVVGGAKVVKSKYKLLSSEQDAKAFYAEVLKEGIGVTGVANGLGEGLIIKYVDAQYKWNLGGSRGPEWTKWKPTFDFDLTIVGFYEGERGTKNEGKLGGLVLEGVDENGTKIKTNCGGFKVSDPRMLPLLEDLASRQPGLQLVDPKKPGYIKNRDQFFRQAFWNLEDEFIGRTVQVEAQELTLAADASVHALRFPQMVMLRDDK